MGRQNSISDKLYAINGIKVPFIVVLGFNQGVLPSTPGPGMRQNPKKTVYPFSFLYEGVQSNKKKKDIFES